MSQRAADAAKALPVAEQELLEWATGRRSWISEVMDMEPRDNLGGAEGRAETLLLVDQRDTAAIALAAEKVRALRLLTGGN